MFLSIGIAVGLNAAASLFAPMVPLPVPLIEVGFDALIPDPALVEAEDWQWCGWSPPVDAAVADPFRPPPHRYGPGNRGIEFDVVSGQVVSAVSEGRVGFVGPVGGRNYVVLHHSSDLRTSYGPLSAISVVRGQSVSGKDAIGQASEGFQLGLRQGGDYLDPAPFLAGLCGTPHLVAVRAL